MRYCVILDDKVGDHFKVHLDVVLNEATQDTVAGLILNTPGVYYAAPEPRYMEIYRTPLYSVDEIMEGVLPVLEEFFDTKMEEVEPYA